MGGENFKITNSGISFISEETDKTGRINFYPADNASVYNLEVSFTYKEVLNGDSTEKTLRYSFGMKNLQELYEESGHYYLTYSQNLLFNMIKPAIADNPYQMTYTYHKDNAFTVSLAAGGNDLYNYIQISQSGGGLSQTIPDYTNIKGGYGVFSSRINITKKLKLSSRTVTDLVPFGFTDISNQ